MRDKLIGNRSSRLASYPVLVILFLFCILSAVKGWAAVACVCALLLLLGVLARLWANRVSRGLTATAEVGTVGLFPGNEALITLHLRNERFLPAIWAEVFSPLSPDLCLIPEHNRKPESKEVPVLKDAGYSTLLVGEQRLSFLMWYEDARLTSRWTAKRRGVYSLSGWRLRTGDPLGMAQVEQPLSGAPRQIAVYPALTEVTPDPFLRSLWNSDTGTRGVMEDPTVIRSTRDYMVSDSLKHINWRLTARGLPLTVNVYEDILPKSIHFLFDGESFSGPEPHREEMEEALSILASELIALSEHQVVCGLSICRSRNAPPENFFAPERPEPLLASLAGYEPLPPKKEPESGKVLPRYAEFDEAAIYEAARHVGRFYYLTRDISALEHSSFPRRLDPGCMTVLTMQPGEQYGEFETLCLQSLREGHANG